MANVLYHPMLELSHFPYQHKNTYKLILFLKNKLEVYYRFESHL